MTLVDTVEKILSGSRRPMNVREIAEAINNQVILDEGDSYSVSSSQIAAAVQSHPELFDTLSGEVFLTRDDSWKAFIKAFTYLKNLFYYRGYTKPLIPYLIFYKRISDMGLLEPDHRANRLRNRLAHTFDHVILEDFNKAIAEIIEIYPSLKQGFVDTLSTINDHSLSDTRRYLLFEILNILDQVDTSYLPDQKFGAVYEYFLHREFSDGDHKYAFTPNPLKEILASLIEPKFEDKVYDPFLGIGGFLAEIVKSKGQDVNLYGSENNRDIYQIGLMSLIMHGLKEQANILLADSLENPFGEKVFDFIITSPPLKQKINYEKYFDLLSSAPFDITLRSDSTLLHVHYILSKLKENGKAVVLLPEVFFFTDNPTVKRYRSYLINKGFIEAIVSIPQGMLLPYTRVNTSILILSKRSQGTENDIVFIDSSQILNTKKGHILSEVLKEALERKNQYDKGVSVLPTEEVLLNDAQLSVLSYGDLYKEKKRLIQEGRAKELQELTEISAGVPNSLIEPIQGGIPVVKTQHLGKEIIDINLNLKKGNGLITAQPTRKRGFIDTESILINRIGTDSYPTIYRPDNTFPAIIIDQGVIALQLRKTKSISADYLYYQLYSPFVQEQIRSARRGTTLPNMSVKALEKILIPIMEDVDSQREFVETQRANLIQIEKERTEERLKSIGFKEEVAQKESDIVRVLVHQLRPTLLGITSQVDKLSRIIYNHNLGQLQEYSQDEIQDEDPELELLEDYSPPENYTVGELFKKLKDNAIQLSDRLTSVNKVMTFNLKPEDFQPIEIQSFLKSYILEKKVEIENKYSVEVSGEKTNVEVNIESMKEMIDQLLANAEKHGFREKPISERRVKFHISKNKVRGICIIEYSNNGRDFPLTLDDLIKPFEKEQGSDGAGIGGNYIYRIISAHGGSIELSKKVKSGLGLRIEIPTNISDHDN